MYESWTEKYAPKKLRDAVGQPQAIKTMLEWARSWGRWEPEKPALLLYGPAGTGKSAAAAALARDFGWDLVELNASDMRTFDAIERIAGSAAASGTLFAGSSGKRLIVLDEADNVHGTADRGGYRAIADLVRATRNPVVLIANDRYAIPAEIQKFCLQANFRRISQESIVKALQRICEAEGIKAEPLALKVIAENSQGDLRSAINDLQAAAAGRRKLSMEDLTLYARDREASIFDFLRGLLHAATCKEARESLWSLDLPPEDALAWISENIPRALADPADLTRAYDALSRADIFLARAKRRQMYEMWSYAGDLMTAGAAIPREGRLKFARFQPPSSKIAYARTRDVRAVRDSLARKVATRCHTSSAVARKHFLPYFAVIFKHDGDAAERIAEELELSDEEREYLERLIQSRPGPIR